MIQEKDVFLQSLSRAKVVSKKSIATLSLLVNSAKSTVGKDEHLCFRLYVYASVLA